MSETTLGQVSLNIQTGPFGSQLHQSDYSETGIPVVMPKDLIDGKISEETIARVGQNHVDRLQKHMINKGDILYSRRGDVGKCAFASEKEFGWLCGTGCLRVTVDESKANPKYVFYKLNEHDTIGWIENHAVGSTMLNLNTEILSSVPLRLPSIDQQNKVVELLDPYDDLIENNRKQIALLEEAAQRLYREWFVDLRFPGYENTSFVDGVPEGWSCQKLVEIADVQYGFAFDGTLFNSDGKGTPIIRIRNIPEGDTQDFTTEQADEKYLIKDGDILVGMDGEFYINSWVGEPAYLVQRTCCIRPKTEDMRGWLMLAIHDPIKFFEKTVTGATVSHLGKKHIDSIEILCGPNELYCPFQKFFAERQILRRQNKKLSEARDRLLPKLMSGEISV